MVKSVAKALGLLDSILECALGGRSAGLGELAEMNGLQDTTARNILKTMEQCGYVARAGVRGYCPGPKCRDLQRLGALEVLVARAAPVLEGLAGSTGHATVLAGLFHGARRVLLRCEGAAVVRVDPLLAEKGDFYGLVTSRVLMAWASPEQLAGLLATYGSPAGRWPGVEAADELDAVLEALRLRGCEMDHPGPSRLALAVPVLDRAGGLLAALGMHMPAAQGQGGGAEACLAAMREAAAAITASV